MSAETEKKVGHRWLLFAAIALVILLLLLWYLWAQTASLDGLKRFVRYSGKHYENYSVSCTDTGACVIADDRLCTASQEGISVYSTDGRLLCREDKPYDSPALKTGNGCFLCYDIGGTQLILLGTDGETKFSLHTDGRIYDAEIAECGAVSVLTEGTDCRAVVQVYSESGAPLFRHDSKSRYLNTCALSPDADFLTVTALGQEDIRFASTAVLFETDRTDTPAELSLDAQIIYDMAFTDAESICAVGESSLQFFTPEGTLLREYQMQSGSLTAYRFAPGTVVASYERYQGGSALVVLDAQGKELAYLEINEAVLHLSTCGNYISVLTEQELRIYDRSLQLCGSTENQGWQAALARSDGTAMCLSDHSALLYIPD
ncbi:MAG: hypothetical protein CW335_00220 [Clostridiales bacterium]|nr:hypothetical protein [Clostridiales bacterium]